MCLQYPRQEDISWKICVLIKHIYLGVLLLDFGTMRMLIMYIDIDTWPCMISIHSFTWIAKDIWCTSSSFTLDYIRAHACHIIPLLRPLYSHKLVLYSLSLCFLGLFASVSKISKAPDQTPSSVTSTPKTPRMDFSRVTGKGKKEKKGVYTLHRMGVNTTFIGISRLVGRAVLLRCQSKGFILYR